MSIPVTTAEDARHAVTDALRKTALLLAPFSGDDPDGFWEAVGADRNCGSRLTEEGDHALLEAREQAVEAHRLLLTLETETSVPHEAGEDLLRARAFLGLLASAMSAFVPGRAGPEGVDPVETLASLHAMARSRYQASLAG